MMWDHAPSELVDAVVVVRPSVCSSALAGVERQSSRARLSLALPPSTARHTGLICNHYVNCVFKLQRELTVRMTGDEISPYKDFFQKQNGRFLAGECALYTRGL